VLSIAPALACALESSSHVAEDAERTPDSLVQTERNLAPASVPPRTIAARATMMRLAAREARRARLAPLETRMYLGLVREAFEHTLDEDLEEEDLAQEFQTTPERAEKALAHIRRLGLLDLSRLAHSDPLTAAEAMQAPWLSTVSDSDLAVLRYLASHRGTAAYPTTIEAAQKAVARTAARTAYPPHESAKAEARAQSDSIAPGARALVRNDSTARGDRAQRLRLALLLRAHPDLLGRATQDEILARALTIMEKRVARAVFFPDGDARTYLTASPPALVSADPLAQRLGMRSDAVREALETLAQLGLLQSDDGDPPRYAITPGTTITRRALAPRAPSRTRAPRPR
jgi:hypothetical protein